MAGLHRTDPRTPEGKYLVLRRDKTVPPWPHFILAASDPAAPFAIRCYADKAEQLGMDQRYVHDLRVLADDFEEWRRNNTTGDPDAPGHRVDDPWVIEMMRSRPGV